MARNTEKDAPYTVSIPRDSELLQLLKADAKDSNLSVAKLIVVRLSDYYKGQRALVALPIPAQTEEPVTTPNREQEEPLLDENTLAAMDAWG